MSVDCDTLLLASTKSLIYQVVHRIQLLMSVELMALIGGGHFAFLERKETNMVMMIHVLP